jgi:CheY-like chemotaxis protein
METCPEYVLVVDDDSACCEGVAALLVEKGYTVRGAANGLQALAIILEYGSPRLIVLDLMMPVMNGAELRRQLRKDPALACIPVVLCSGVEGLDAYASVLDCTAFMTKPLDPSKLATTVGRLAPLIH